MIIDILLNKINKSNIDKDTMDIPLHRFVDDKKMTKTRVFRMYFNEKRWKFIVISKRNSLKKLSQKDE